MASFEKLFIAAAASARQPLTSSNDIAEASAAVMALHTAFRHRLGGRWDLAKIVSSTLRLTLASGQDAAGLSAGLLSLLAVGLHVSPLPGHRDLSLAVKTKRYGQLTSAAVSELAAALAAAPDGPVGALVLLSLFNQWHRIELLARGHWESFAALSQLILEMLRPLSTIAVGQGALRTYAECWLSNLLEYGSGEGGAAALVAGYLGSLSCSTPEAATMVRVASASPPVQQHWRALWRLLLEGSPAAVTVYSAEVRRVWDGEVRPVLARAFRHEPPPLSETFFLPPALTDADCESFGCSAVAALGAAAHGEGMGRQFAAVELVTGAAAYFSSSDGDGEGSEGRRLVTAAEYDGLLRPLLTVALHTGRTAHAESLLGWLAASLEDRDRADYCERWWRRLHALHNGSALGGTDLALRWRSIVTEGQDRRTAIAVWPECAAEAASHLDCDAALDLLVTANTLLELRVVIDACLLPSRGGPSWPRLLLSDPLAAAFLVRGVAKVAHLLLNDGAAPLARAYATRLALCAPACPAQETLVLLLQTVARLGAVLGAEGGLGGHPGGGEAAEARWRGMGLSLRRTLPAQPQAHFRLDGVQWRQYSQREDGDGAGGASGGTRVSLALDGDDVILQRAWALKGMGAGATAVLRLRGRRPHLLRLLGEARLVMESNRRQLLRGSAGEDIAAEAGRASAGDVLSPSSSPSIKDCDAPCEEGGDETTAAGETARRQPTTPEPPPGEKQARKLAWWRERFDLDGRMHGVVEGLAAALGAAGASFFLGEPAAEAQVVLWGLAGDLTAALAAAEENSDIMGVILGGRFRSLFYCLINALPYMARCTPSNVESGPPRATATPEAPHGQQEQERPAVAYQYQVQCRLCPHSEDLGHACTVCGPDAVASIPCGLAAAVEELLANAREEQCNTSSCGQETPLDASQPPEQHGSVALLPFVLAALRAMAARVESDATGHRDLARLSRQHLYLVLPGSLHALPVEGLRPLRQGSCSRVPSMAWLAQATATADGAAEAPCSLDRAFFLVDSAAVSHADSFGRLFARHPEWAVRHADTSGANPLCPSGDGSLLQSLVRERRTAYVFMGHRRGEAFLSARELYSCCGEGRGGSAEPQQLPRLAVLMGCSSARMVGSSEFSCFGMPAAFLHAGTRCVVGCLWDITDGDADRLAGRFLRLALTQGAGGRLPATVGEVLAAARSACKLPCLSSLATVVYGLNCPILNAPLTT